MTAVVSSDDDDKFHFSIDRGGTFTDVYCRLPRGADGVRREDVSKLLSVDPARYADAPTEGVRRVLARFRGDDPDDVVDERGRVRSRRIASIRMGTTVATNALLEREGERTLLVTTKGFADLTTIGDQDRPDIFDLTCAGPAPLHEAVVEIDERVAPRWSAAEEDVGEVVVSATGERVRVLRRPDPDAVRAALTKVYHETGIRSVAVCLLHSFAHDAHERLVGEIAAEVGFEQISLSSAVMPMVKAVGRAHTACAAAYLTPAVSTYLRTFLAGFDDDLSKNTRVAFMRSDGGLAPADAFGGHRAVLSGPAGGAVGYARSCYDGVRPVVGLDVGGTSTDVSRYDGRLEHVTETVVAGVPLRAPQLDVRTVAAGGGSLLALERGRLVVGPGSAGARPGPVCYRRAGGRLAVTDANVVCGRVSPEHFPAIFGETEKEPLDAAASLRAMEELRLRHREELGPEVDEAAALAYGFLRVANEAVCRPIRALTRHRGHEPSAHVLACFGGAGPQHACAVARTLGMRTVFVHRHGGVLSAYGIDAADAVEERQSPAADVWDDDDDAQRDARLAPLAEEATRALTDQGYPEDDVVIERYLHLRYEGTDNAVMVPESDDGRTYLENFVARYKVEFGFALENRAVIVDDYRVRAVVPGPAPVINRSPLPTDVPPPPVLGRSRAYFENGWEDIDLYDMRSLRPGHVVQGPSIIVQAISTVVLEIDCVATVTHEGDLVIDVGDGKTRTRPVQETADGTNQTVVENPVRLSVYGHRFMGIAEQMGRALERTAVSVNIKERLDFSCALFAADGGLVANAPHIPVHLGAMQSAVKAQIDHWRERGVPIVAGDVLVSNCPHAAGGSHLPDITVITPVFDEETRTETLFFVASRGHHADVGGVSPGSMPPHSRTLEEEGCRIVAFKLVERGVFQEKGISDLLTGNRFAGTRNLGDNLDDLRAQVAANAAGVRLLRELVDERGLNEVRAYMGFLQSNAARSVRDLFRETCGDAPRRRLTALDHMDDGTPIALTVDIDKETGDAVFDFTGTGPQVLGNHNAPLTVTYSAVIYSLRCMVGGDVPLNQGCLAPVTFRIPPRSLLCPSAGAAVVGGNVLTSQRVVDVVLEAFGACAASQGCMNNLTLGDASFGYYETIAGGAGAGPTWNGRSGVQTHCTNTRITDPEILERRYPVRLREFSLRRGSGGAGRLRGGDGVVREIEPLRPLTVSVLSERRARAPHGAAGGADAAPGRNLLVRRRDDDDDDLVVNVGGRCSLEIGPGDRLRIETPGGGGYGTPPIEE